MMTAIVVKITMVTTWWSVCASLGFPEELLEGDVTMVVKSVPETVAESVLRSSIEPALEMVLETMLVVLV